MALKTSYFILVLLLSLISGQVFAHDFNQVKLLIKENRFQQAYELLMSDEINHMGEPVYDFLLARSSMKLKRYHEAIFAYERVLINQPANRLARLELALAYFRIEELETAERLFRELSLTRPPENISSTIQSYLEIIEQKLSSRRHALGYEISLREGWDSNINSATNESEIELTVGTYRPTEGVDKETSDSYTELVSRLNYGYTLNENAHLYSQLGYTNKENNNKEFDSQMADAVFGYRQSTSIGRISIPLSWQVMWLDEKQLREVTSINTNLNRSDKTSFTDYNLQYGEIRYPGSPALNVDYYSVSFAFGVSGESGFGQQYALFYGDETETRSIYRFNARSYHGAQARFPWRVGHGHLLTPKIVYQEAEYKARHPFFKQKRQDRMSYVELSWQWFFTRRWSLTSHISHTQSSSSVDIYTHTRNRVYTGIKYSY